MGIEAITLILFGGLLLLLALGLPLVFALGGTAVVGTYFLWGPNALYVTAIRTFDSATSFVLLSIPMFIFMGCMLERSGMARELYEMMYKWLGGISGGLATGTVLICAIFAAMVGVSGAATVTMALIALPSMLEHRYDKQLAIGCIAGGGALGVLIPPSVLMIVLGLYTNTSIGQMFAAGIPAGLIIVGLFIAYITIRAWLQPELAPPVTPQERATWRERLVSLRAVLLPIVLVIGVLGSIISGAATPSEAAGVGALGSILCAAAYRQLTWRNLLDSSYATLRLSCMVMWIVFAASIFTALYAAIGAQDLVRSALSHLPGGRWGVIIGIQIIWLIMGAFLDPIGIMIITAPLFFPIATSLGFDPVWFGILFVVNMEMAFLTPPFGFNLFYIRGVAPKSVTMLDIYKSITPFVLLQATALAIIMAFPDSVMWLPKMLLR
jgi:tripartite ATP-independent transporter DctM subunit